MPGREYLLKGLEDKDVKAYLNYQIELATLLGADRERARREQTDVVLFEIKLANVSFEFHYLELLLAKFFFFFYLSKKVNFLSKF